MSRPETNLTGWFAGDVNPVRDGVYETMEPDGKTFYNAWRNSRWFWGYSVVENDHEGQDAWTRGKAAEPARNPMPYDKRARLVTKWRGLAYDPAGVVTGNTP